MCRNQKDIVSSVLCVGIAVEVAQLVFCMDVDLDIEQIEYSDVCMNCCRDCVCTKCVLCDVYELQ